MRKILIILITFSTLTSCVKKTFEEKAEKSNVFIRIINGEKVFAVNGIIIDDKILSVWHCFDEYNSEQKIIVTYSNGKESEASIFKKDSANDLIMLVPKKIKIKKSYVITKNELENRYKEPDDILIFESNIMIIDTVSYQISQEKMDLFYNHRNDVIITNKNVKHSFYRFYQLIGSSKKISRLDGISGSFVFSNNSFGLISNGSCSANPFDKTEMYFNLNAVPAEKILKIL